MLNQRLAAAREVADQLFAAERAIDAALTEIAALTACMPRVRVEANLGANIGQAAMERSAAAMSAIIEARREIVAAHEELSAAKEQIGLRTVAVGGGAYKGPNAPTGQLSVVSSAA